MSDSKIPDQWLHISLGDVIDYGKAEKTEPSEIDDSTWVLELEDIEKDSSKLLSRVRFLDRQSKSTKNRFQKGDVLYGKLRPYLNKVIVADEDGVCSTEIVPLSGSPQLVNRYIFHWLKHPTFIEYVTAAGYGVNMPRLGTKEGLAAPFVLAPLAEQKQIATKLDELLVQVDTLKARLDAIPAILKRFRQSVLAAAVSGRLTEGWRTQNKTSSISEQIDAAHKSRKGLLKVREKDGWKENIDLFNLPETWEWLPNHLLAEDSQTAICAGPFGTIFKAKDFRESGIPIIFLRHVKSDGFNQNKPTYMEPLVWKELHQEYSVHGGELLVTKLGDPPGDSCIYPKNIGTAMVTPDVLKMNVDRSVAITEYLRSYFNSPVCKEMITKLAFGATRLRIDIAMFKSFPIPTPPLEEQTEIVRRVEQLFTFADQVEQRVRDAQARVNHLTQSILAKAFRGELTADWRGQNPELISGDHSAEALLARIRAERQQPRQPKRGRRTKA